MKRKAKKQIKVQKQTQMKNVKQLLTSNLSKAHVKRDSIGPATCAVYSVQ